VLVYYYVKRFCFKYALICKYFKALVSNSFLIGFCWSSDLFDEIPVKDVVVREALAVEQIPDELAEVRVVGLLLETQRPAVVEISRELGCG
jgi:hypothetical protein